MASEPQPKGWLIEHVDDHHGTRVDECTFCPTASICGEVGTRFPSGDVDPVHTEPCVFLDNHKPEMMHSWEIREVQEEQAGIAPGTYKP